MGNVNFLNMSARNFIFDSHANGWLHGKGAAQNVTWEAPLDWASQFVNVNGQLRRLHVRSAGNRTAAGTAVNRQTQVDQRGDSIVPSGARVAVLRPRAFNQSEGMGEDMLPTQGAGAKSGLALTILQSTPGEDVRPGGTQRGRVSPWRRVPSRTHPPWDARPGPGGMSGRTSHDQVQSLLTLALSIHCHDCRNLSLDHGVQQGSMSYAVMTRVHDSTISVHDWGTEVGPTARQDVMFCGLILHASQACACTARAFSPSSRSVQLGAVAPRGCPAFCARRLSAMTVAEAWRATPCP